MRTTITIDANDLRTLLTAPSAIAGDIGEHPLIRSVELHAEAGWLYATASDRYRAIVSRTRCKTPGAAFPDDTDHAAVLDLDSTPDTAWSGFTAFVLAADLQQALQVARLGAADWPRLETTLTFDQPDDQDPGPDSDSGRVTIALGDSVVVRHRLVRPHDTGRHPAAHIIRDTAFGPRHPISPDMNLDGTLLATIASLAEDTPSRSGRRSLAIWGSGDTRDRPAAFAINPDERGHSNVVGVIMPLRRRRSDGSEFAGLPPHPADDRSWLRYADPCDTEPAAATPSESDE